MTHNWQSEAWCSQRRSSPHTKAHHFIARISITAPEHSVTDEFYFWLWISVVLQDLIPRHPPLGQCNCSENVLVVKHIKHVQSLQHLENKGVFILVGMLSEKCNLNTGREQCVLFRHTSSFFHSFPAAIITCVYAWAILSSAPRPALQSTSAFQPKAAEIREDAQVWVPEGLTLCTSYPAHHSCWEKQKQHLKVW